MTGGFVWLIIAIQGHKETSEEEAHKTPALPTYSLSGHLKWAFLATTPPADPVMLVAAGEVTNTGDPTSLHAWRAFLQPYSGSSIEGTIRLADEGDALVPMPPKKPLKISKDVFWENAAGTHVFQKGDILRGTLVATFPHLSKADLAKLGNIKAVISFSDDAGRVYPVESGPLTPGTITWPGGAHSNGKPCPNGTIQVGELRADNTVNAVVTHGNPCEAISKATITNSHNGLNINPEAEKPTEPPVATPPQ
jgi:hypothetical protein